MTSSIPVDRQHSNLPGSSTSHASPGATMLPPHHARATRMLPRQADADAEMQAPSRVDGSNDGIGYIDSAVPSSPAQSLDRMSACSSSGRGQRKVMALHASHAGMREGVGHHGSYAQAAFLGPTGRRNASPAAREHLVSPCWMLLAKSCRFRAVAFGTFKFWGCRNLTGVPHVDWMAVASHLLRSLFKDFKLGPCLMVTWLNTGSNYKHLSSQPDWILVRPRGSGTCHRDLCCRFRPPHHQVAWHKGGRFRMIQAERVT